MQLSVYNQQGQKVSTLEVSDAVFGVKYKPHVIHEAAVAQYSNARVVTAHTKTRGEVAGGGKKPWRQKGTGRARAGSIRSPLWRGGGVVFGPRSNRNFAKKINRKVRRTAILMSLSDKVVSGTMVVLDSLTISEQKTKAVAQMIKALPLKRGSTLLVLPASAKSAGRLARNIAGVNPIAAGSLNVVDLLKHTNLVTTMAGIEEIEKIYKLHQ